MLLRIRLFTHNLIHLVIDIEQIIVKILPNLTWFLHIVWRQVRFYLLLTCGKIRRNVLISWTSHFFDISISAAFSYLSLELFCVHCTRDKTSSKLKTPLFRTNRRIYWNTRVTVTVLNALLLSKWIQIQIQIQFSRRVSVCDDFVVSTFFCPLPYLIIQNLLCKFWNFISLFYDFFNCLHRYFEIEFPNVGKCRTINTVISIVMSGAKAELSRVKIRLAEHWYNVCK